MFRSGSILLLSCAAGASPASDRKAFVLLGATGDNAYRPAGVWSGLYEAWCNGIFVAQPTDLHVQINQGHTVEEVHDKALKALTPLHDILAADPSWKCLTKNQDCSPETFFNIGNFNVWEGAGKYNATGQAANMSYLAKYEEVIAYMSIPPSAYGEWVGSMVKYWGGSSKVQIAFEKPFGGGRNSLQDATDLHDQIIKAGLDESSFHLTDHWLSFFMNEQLPAFKKIVQDRLNIEFDRTHIEKIVVTEYEERGFGGRGAFINGLGQVRDMVQSHLLQVLALTLMGPNVTSVSAAKLDIFNEMDVSSCELKQFDGLLKSHKMTYHADFADSTFSRVNLKSRNPQWKDVELVIQTGKAMDIQLYTIEVYQRGGAGVLTFDIGKEEVGTGDIKVENWPLQNSNSFKAPLPGFGSTSTKVMTPKVDNTGTGYILAYNDPSLYFPKPYAKIVKALLSADYGAAFVTWPECQRCWEIVTGSSPKQCLDPAPKDVQVYIPSFLCDKVAPDLCDQHMNVEELYEGTFSCNEQHDTWYKDVDFYKDKCHHPSKQIVV